MAQIQVPVSPLPRPAKIQGVYAANLRARTLERRTALVVVILPVVGLFAGIALMWGHGVGPTELGLLAAMYFLTSIGIGIGYHRLIAHGSFQTWPAGRVVWAILGSMAAQGPVLYWAAIHRRHHSCSDRPGDPHSPHLDRGEGIAGLLGGLWHAHLGWLFTHEITDWGRFITDLLRDRGLFLVNRLYFLWVLLGLAIPTVLGGVLSGTGWGALMGFLFGGLIRVVLVHHVTWSVNSICHVYGTAPFRAPDESRNNVWIALPSFGEGWHNNHHAFPYSARHGLRWWEFDLNAWIIQGLACVGLAWNLKAPTTEMMHEARKDVLPAK
jgi:stearoyl-CoA desaturase (delta-9 desaturase)